MKTDYLLPFRFKLIGWFLLIFGVLFSIIMLSLGWNPFFDSQGFDFLNLKVFALIDKEPTSVSTSFFTITNNIFIDEFIVLSIIVGTICIGFSKEKKEDELISKIRLDSLVWAVYVNYIILILATLFVYRLAFLWTLACNMFSILFFFIIKFNWMKYKSKKLLNDEE